MALNPPMLASMIRMKLAAKKIKGKTVPKFCKAFSEALITYLKESAKVTTIDSGMIVVGKGVGKVAGIHPVILTNLVKSLMMAKGIKGKQIMDYAQAVCESVVLHITLMGVVNTTSAGIAVGPGVGKVLGLVPKALSSKLKSKMNSAGIKGKTIQGFTDAFSTGFCTHTMLTGIVSVVIVGGPVLVLGAPIPGAGAGTGTIS